MLEDDQKFRLIIAAVKMQKIIATLEMDLEIQTLSDIYCPSDKSLQDEVQTLEYSKAEIQVAGGDMLPSQSDNKEDLYSSLNKTIYNLSNLVDQINNNLAMH